VQFNTQLIIFTIHINQQIQVVNTKKANSVIAINLLEKKEEEEEINEKIARVDSVK
jgi:hypothetical protein